MAAQGTESNLGAHGVVGKWEGNGVPMWVHSVGEGEDHDHATWVCHVVMGRVEGMWCPWAGGMQYSSGGGIHGVYAWGEGGCALPWCKPWDVWSLSSWKLDSPDVDIDMCKSFRRLAA